MLELRMDADEKEICDFLKSWPGQFVSPREICKRAGGKWKFREDEKWAIPILLRMVGKSLLEADASGHVRLQVKQRKDIKKQWASPQMKKILDESGAEFEGIVEADTGVDPE
jgi:hypothetical protein